MCSGTKIQYYIKCTNVDNSLQQVADAMNCVVSIIYMYKDVFYIAIQNF